MEFLWIGYNDKNNAHVLTRVRDKKVFVKVGNLNNF